jgi:hypothetical protein
MIMDKKKKSGSTAIVIAVFFSFFVYLYLGNYKRFIFWAGIFLGIFLIGFFSNNIFIYFMGGFLELGVWISSIREAFSFAKT